MPDRKLGEILIGRGAIDRTTLLDALSIQRATGERLGSILLRLEAVDASLLAAALGEQHRVEPADLARPPSPEALTRLPAAVAYRLATLPLEVREGRLVVAMADPTDAAAVAAVEDAAGMPVEPRVAPLTALYRGIRRAYEAGDWVDVPRVRRLLREIHDRLAEIEALLGPAPPRGTGGPDPP